MCGTGVWVCGKKGRAPCVNRIGTQCVTRLKGQCMNRLRRGFLSPLLHSEQRGNDLCLWGIFVSTCNWLPSCFITVLDSDLAFLELRG